MGKEKIHVSLVVTADIMSLSADTQMHDGTTRRQSDVIAVQEVPKTSYDTSKIEETMKARGYSATPFFRNYDTTGGGTVLFVNNHRFKVEQINSAVRDAHQYVLEASLVRLKDKLGVAEDVTIAGIYMPPIGVARGDNQRGAAIASAALRNFLLTHRPHCLMGDFNARHRIWDPGGIPRGNENGKRGTAFDDLFTELLYTVYSPGPTHDGSHIDFFLCRQDAAMDMMSTFTSMTQEMARLGILDDDNGGHVRRPRRTTQGHAVIHGTLLINPLAIPVPRDIGMQKFPKCHWDSATKEQREAAIVTLEQQCSTPFAGSVNRKARQLELALQAARLKIPSGKSPQRRSLRWLKELEEKAAELHRRAQEAAAIVRVQNGEIDDELEETITQIRKDLAGYRVHAEKMCARVIPAVADGATKVVAAHSVMNRALNPSPFTADIIHNNETWKTDQEKCEGLSKMFKEKHQRRGPPNPANARHRPRAAGEAVPAVVRDEIVAAIKDNGDGKAVDYQGVDAELLKLACRSPSAIQRIAELYTAIIRRGRLPKHWKMAVATALLKPGKAPQHPKSYRPVAITSLLCRTLERIALRRMLKTLRLPHHQYGFREGSSCVEPLALFSTTVTDGFGYAQQFTDKLKPLKEMQQPAYGDRPARTKTAHPQTRNSFRTLVASIDLTDAFCRVTREEVLEQYQKNGGSWHYAAFLHDFLSDRTQRTRFGDAMSETVEELDLGVPQGSVLGPLCFVLAAVDLVKSIRTVVEANKSKIGFLDTRQGTEETRLPPFGLAWYADDSFIALSGPSANKLVPVMQLALDAFGQWAARHGLEISAKSTIQLFMTRQSDKTKNEDGEMPEITETKRLINDLRCGGVNLKPDEENGESIFTPRRLLGVIFDSRMNMEDHVEKQLYDAKKRLATLLPFADHWSPRVIREVYYAHIFSKLTYASETWYHLTSDAARTKLDVFHYSAMKKLLGLYPTVKNETARAMMDLPTIAEHAERQRNRMAASIVARDKRCPLRQRLLMTHDLKSKGTTTGVLQDRSIRPLCSAILAAEKSMFRRIKNDATISTVDYSVVNDNVKFHIEKFEGVSAKESSEEELKECNDRRLAPLPATSTVQVFVDGSLHGDGRCGWAAIIVYRDADGNEIEEQRIKLQGRGTRYHCICTLEGIALLEVFKRLAREQPLGPVVVASDSLSMLQTLAKGPHRQTYPIGSRIWKLLAQIAQFQPVHLAHVFSHVGTEGNELADEEAGKAVDNMNLAVWPATPFDVARFHTTKRVKAAFVAEKLVDFIPKSKAGNPLPAPTIYRRLSEAKIIHRLYAGHEYWIGSWRGEAADNCPVCNVRLNRELAARHPTYHCLNGCSDDKVRGLRMKHFGNERPPLEILFTKQDKVINYYMEWRKVAKEATERRRANRREQ